jgi:hypothetical protein
MRTKLMGLALVILATLLAGTHEAGGWTWYHGKNTGIVVGPEGHSCGFEFRGDFGPFCD